MPKKHFEPFYRKSGEIVHRMVGYQYLLYAVVFGLFAIVLFQYWQALHQPPTEGYSEISVGGVAVQIRAPDHLLPGNENQQEFELVVDYQKIPAYTRMMIAIDSPDKNAGFSRNSFAFTNESTNEENNKAVVYYNGVVPGAKSFEVQATVNIGKEQGFVSRTIIVANPSSSIMAFLSSVLAGLLALFTLKIQISRSLERSS